MSDNPPSTSNDSEIGLRAYYPIFLIAAYIIGVASINNFNWQGMNWQGWMSQFMAGFFLVFSAFKLLDIRGFAEGYSTYDLLAKRWYTYGYIYPFIELILGILYLTQLLPTATQMATIIIMGFSSIGVINSLLKKQKFQCACLGTILKVPLSSITLIEDLTMVVLAALSLMMG
jgi:Methylamine utilisation protein MauE